MLNSLRFCLLSSLIFCWAPLSIAVNDCPPQSSTKIENQVQTLLKTSCVSTCTKLLQGETSDDLKRYSENCEIFAKQGNPETRAESIEDAKRAIDKATLLCLPVAAKNTVVGTYELVKALPAMVGYLVSGVWAKDFDGARTEALEFCKGSPDCRRAMARNTIRFQNKKPDGTWQTSDEEVDRQIESLDFYDLHRQALHDVPLSKNECMGHLGSLRRKMASDGEEWTEERHRSVASQLEQEFPHCPGILKFTQPPISVPKSEESLMECLARPGQAPFACLSPSEIFAVSNTCNGILETCAAVTEFFLPVPGLGKVTKFIKAGKANVAATVVKDGVEVAESKPVRALNLAQKGFVNSYKDRVFVSEANNRSYISLAERSAKAVSENKTRYFDIENSAMKKLNDATNDKELVTSLTNYQKETVLKRLDPLKEKYPDVDFEVYSDFKSVKIALKSKKEIDPATNEKILRDLNKLYAESNKDFTAKMKELDIEVPEAGSVDQWFKAGYGKSVDEAALAARKARQSKESGILEYSSPEVRESMSQNLAAVEKKRQGLANSQSFKSLMQKNRNGVSLPREDVLDLVRKNDNPEALAKAISQRYEVSGFTNKDAAQLLDYAKGVDEFSPTILIAKRETVNLDNAELGGLSADFLGMGSANLKATAEGIAQKESLEQALIGAREGEKKVTRIFKERMEKFRKIVGDASCSGDDCAMAKLMSEKEKIAVMQKLAVNPETRGVRMSFIGSNVSPEVRMKLASHGESIEKVFRKELEGKIPFSKLNKMTFGFDMKSTQLNEGSVNLILGKGRGTRLSVKEQKEMNEAFARALEKHNKNKSAAYLQGTEKYNATQIHWVPGVSVFGPEEDEP